MIKISNHPTDSIVLAANTGHISVSNKECHLCGRSENFTGMMSYLNPKGEIYVWFWCIDHRESFEKNIEAIGTFWADEKCYNVRDFRST